MSICSVWRPLLHRGWLLGLGFYMACHPLEQMEQAAEASLVFDKDTLLFDTLLSALETPTLFVHLHNPSRHKIRLHTLGMEQASSSSFRVSVKGTQGYRLNDIEILGGDSVLLAIRPELENGGRFAPYRVEDRICAETGIFRSCMVLRGWGQDVQHFRNILRITSDTQWKSGEARLFDQGLEIVKGATLRIEGSSRLFFGRGAILRVEGSLYAEGTPENPIWFVQARRDRAYATSSGAWRGIFFAGGYGESHLTHAYVGGAEIAVQIGEASVRQQGAPIELRQVRIFNASIGAILGYNAHLTASNTLIYHARNYILLHYGGRYRYNHCSFVNFPYHFIRRSPSFQWLDAFSNGSSVSCDIMLQNSILWGRLPEEFDISPATLLSISGSVLRTSRADLRRFSTRSILDTELHTPAFVSPLERDYHLQASSPAIGRAEVGLDTDIEGRRRDNQPDAGAYEYIP